MISKMHGPRRKAGLTLLEVLAAVMIFAMVMTVLIGTSTNAVHHVGVSARKLEADLFADNLLSDLEVQIKQGMAPTIEDGEFEAEQFSVLMTRTKIFPDNPDSTPGSATSLAGGGSAASSDVLSQLGAALPEVAGHLMQYDIDVSWLEQNGPQHVTRTTFAFDWQAAQAELAAFAQSASQNGVSGLGDDGTGKSTDAGSGGGGASGGTTGASRGNRGGRNVLPPTFNGSNAGERQRAGRAGRGPRR